MTPLWTIGYQGFTADEWLDSLVTNGIRTVVDVREMPLSRKAGFSKSRLAEALAARGIRYVHLRSLGNPKPYRQRLRDGWSFAEFQAEFVHVLEQEPDALEMLSSLALDGGACLVCFEEDPTQCHRSIVADYVVQRIPELHVSHLRYA